MQAKDTYFSRKQTINIQGDLYDIRTPKVMGILNITPDSFYDGGRYNSDKPILQQTEKLITDGADIIDIGAYSSRPGADQVSENDELNRLVKALKLIREKYPKTIISVDTFRSNIAKTVVMDFEVDIINDISAGDLDSEMFNTVADLKVPYIMMHMQGTPDTMQKNPNYSNVVQEIMMYFSKKIHELKRLGVGDIIIDPGFGFGKTVEHNYRLLKYLDDFKIFELPILAGVSRKSMICKVLKINPKDALNGTTVVNTLSLLGGANILRVHDVKEAKQTIQLVEKFTHAKVDNWHD